MSWLTVLGLAALCATCGDDAVLLCEELEACGRLDVSTSECVAKLDEQTAAKVSSCAHCVANNECAVLAMGVCDVQCQ